MLSVVQRQHQRTALRRRIHRRINGDVRAFIRHAVRQRHRRRIHRVIHRHRRRVRRVQRLVAATSIAAANAVHQRLAINVAVFAVRVRERHATRRRTRYDRDRLAIVQRQHQVTALRCVVHGRTEGDVITFIYRYVTQGHRAAIYRVRHRHRRRRAGVQIFIITTGCARDAVTLRAAINVNVFAVRVRERHAARGLAHRDGDRLSVAQRQHQVAGARRIVHRRRQRNV